MAAAACQGVAAQTGAPAGFALARCAVAFSAAARRKTGAVCATRTRDPRITNGKYGPTELLDLTPHDLMASLARSKHTPDEQQHAYVILRAFLRRAHRKHYLDRNPMERMREPRSHIPRARILTNDELKRVWQATEDDTIGKIVKPLILTGQRRGKITQLTGSMVGEDTIILPAGSRRTAASTPSRSGAWRTPSRPARRKGRMFLPGARQGDAVQRLLEMQAETRKALRRIQLDAPRSVPHVRLTTSCPKCERRLRSWERHVRKLVTI